MKSRLPIFLPLVLCLFLTPTGTGQELLHFPHEEQIWANPHPGLGNVSPGSASASKSVPSAIPLYAHDPEPESSPELFPLVKSTELYLARKPGNKRTGFFQRADFNTLWAPGSGSKRLGMTELDLSATFAMPMLTPDSPLVLTPKFSTTFFDADGWDETFYTTGLAMRWIRPVVKNKLTADLGVSVLYSGDFKAKGRDTIRVPMHLAGVWNFNPRTKIVLGVVYADRRDNYNVFPMAGLVWDPNEDVSIELLVPRLRVAQRIRWFGSAAGDESSDWLYTALEFGGGSWGYDRFDGRAEYRDYRLSLGYERRTRLGLTLGLEVGYMFDRKMDLEHIGSTHPSDSVFLRLRSSF